MPHQFLLLTVVFIYLIFILCEKAGLLIDLRPYYIMRGFTHVFGFSHICLAFFSRFGYQHVSIKNARKMFNELTLISSYVYQGYCIDTIRGDVQLPSHYQVEL